VAAPLLAKNIGTDFLDTREVLTSDLYRAPSKEAIEALDALMKKEADRSGADYHLDHLRLKYAKAYLKNHTK